jgi:hypothetical protein
MTNQKFMEKAIKLGFVELIDDGMGTPFYATVKQKFHFEFGGGYSRFVGVENLKTMVGSPLRVFDMDKNILILA